MWDKAGQMFRAVSIDGIKRIRRQKPWSAARMREAPLSRRTAINKEN